jgi:hypothetical protein
VKSFGIDYLPFRKAFEYLVVLKFKQILILVFKEIRSYNIK